MAENGFRFSQYWLLPTKHLEGIIRELLIFKFLFLTFQILFKEGIKISSSVFHSLPIKEPCQYNKLSLIEYESAMRYQKLSQYLALLKSKAMRSICEPPRKSNFLKNDKIVISVKIRNFSRSQMTKRTSPLESSREI